MRTNLKLVEDTNSKTLLAHGQRPIVTTYYDKKGNLIKTTRSLLARNAVRNCVDHMQVNDYGAATAEVFDERCGSLHAVVVFTVKGKMEIVFKRESKVGE